MIKLISAFLLVSTWMAAADCTFSYALRAGQSTRALNNKEKGCVRWVLTYSGDSPVTVEHSTNGTSGWDSVGFTVTSGSLPSGTGFGRVEFAGYAPFVRVRLTGTDASQKSEGVINGSQALLATAIPASTPLIGSYTAPVAADWSWVTSNAPITQAGANGALTIFKQAGNVGGSSTPNLLCKSVSDVSADKIYRMTILLPGDHIYRDGQNEVGFALRKSSTNEIILQVFQLGNGHTSDNPVKGFYYCDLDNCAGTILDLYGGGFTTNTMLGMNVPFSVVIKTTSTAYRAQAWDGARGIDARVPNENSALRSSTVNTFDQACLWVVGGNGNYPTYVNLLGYDEALLQ